MSTQKQYMKSDRDISSIAPGDLFVMFYDTWYTGQESMDRVTNEYGNLFVVDRVIHDIFKGKKRVIIERHRNNGNDCLESSHAFEEGVKIHYTIVEEIKAPSVIDKSHNIPGGAILKISSDDSPGGVYTSENYVYTQLRGYNEGAYLDGDSIREVIRLLKCVLTEKGW